MDVLDRVGPRPRPRTDVKRATASVGSGRQPIEHRQSGPPSLARAAFPPNNHPTSLAPSPTLAMDAANNKKTEVEHEEFPDKGEGAPVMKSSLDKLSLLQSISVYRKTVAICSIAAFSASCDGYQNQIAGSSKSHNRCPSCSWVVPGPGQGSGTSWAPLPRSRLTVALSLLHSHR